MSKPDTPTQIMLAFSGASQLSTSLWDELVAEREAHANPKEELAACQNKVEVDAGRDI